ncbi:TonB-dependent receptor domain-containing protein [Steroidobacter agaridevorans]|uniref:TonB-dependent receptor domain-containing protein n=1 Tax=Steroidobacter agaridevorans TaxID=2695856 RepID=UPI00137AE98B|nr:TonB-dependent receptor [Steroidobacter agaridevorans]
MEGDQALARDYAENVRSSTGYPADPGACGNVMLGPLPPGEYTGEEAWRTLIAPLCTIKQVPEGISGRMRWVADMSQCQCSFGFPQYTGLQSAHVLVQEPPLPQLGDAIPSEVVVLTRQRIEQTGAASVLDLLRYLSQTAFHRGRGFRDSGAQYAELRGLGAGYTLVLLNGRRTFGSATNLIVNAYDLSYLPISAVERVEVSMDANSLLHGMDAIGGIVNVVLRNNTPTAASIRYGQSRGGGSQSQASMSGSHLGERGRVAVYVDIENAEELLGHERERWNNQDFGRFGGTDFRAPLGLPANVRSSGDQPLPGLDSPIAAAANDPRTGGLTFEAGRQDRTSLRAFQAVVPEGSRASLLATGALVRGATVASLEVLGVRRDNELQLMPTFVRDATLSERHPENSFGVPVKIDAVLAGLPAQRQHYQTTSLRGVAALEGPLWQGERWGDWDYAAYLTHSDERTRAQLRNVTNPAAVSASLNAVEGSAPLSLYRPVSVLPAALLSATPVERYHASATHLNATVQGAPFGVKTFLGVEGRLERIDFDTRLRGADRVILSTFAQAQLPLDLLWPGVERLQALSLIAGVRAERYSDIGAEFKSQIGARWEPSNVWRVQVAYSESFRPPSLVELYLPPLTAPATLFDARRGEVAMVTLITGGNPNLRPTTGQARSLGITYQPREQWRFAAEFWHIKVRNHVSLLAPMSLLTHEDEAIEERIKRSEQTPADAAIHLWGPLEQLDISRANVGGAQTQGVDLSAELRLETPLGIFTPRLSVTLTDKFAYSELPTRSIRLEDRTDVAAELGTIPAQRGVVSLTYERGGWEASVYAHLKSSYHDRNPFTDETLARRVGGPPLWDLSISTPLAANLRFSFGATNVFDREPPFANAGGSLGYDTSQYELQGRVLYGMLSGAF